MMHVSSFYSFKGGVGQTLLLANVGVALARSHRKVLLWDLDLEAPGMHFISGLEPRRRLANGFLEWLLQWQAADFAPVDGYLLKSFLGLPYDVPDIPGLLVLPAFGAHSSFANLYQRIAWSQFTIDRPELGRQLFESLLDGLAEHQGVDHVLMDSRTGITDLGGLLTAVLPHATVLVGNYSAQNTQGLLSVYRALQPAVEGKLVERRYGQLQRLLIASPVPFEESKSSLAARRSLWNSEFKTPPDETRVEIPFLTRLLFGEELLVDTDIQSPTANAYREVASRLDTLREDRVQQEESAALGNLLYRDLAASRHKVNPRKSADKGLTFIQQTERLLQLMGYTVSRRAVDEPWDLEAHRQSGFIHERYWVVCDASRPTLGRPQVEELSEKLREAARGDSATRLMLVTSTLSLSAHELAQRFGWLSLTLADLERRLFDFKPYLARLRRNYEESTLARTYIPSRLIDRSMESPSTPLEERARAWAHGDGEQLWVILGETGTGKSSFIHRFAYELATEAEKKENAPVPLLLSLRNFSALATLETLLQEHLASSIGWRGDPAILLHLLAAGRMVLLLDGLDEMAAVDLSPTMLEEQFRQLVRITGLTAETPRSNRVLITARAGLFQSSRAETPEGVGQTQDMPLNRIALALGAKVDEFAPWDMAQLEEFLMRSLGSAKKEQWTPLLAFIERKHELRSRPLFLEMLLSVLPHASDLDETLNLGLLFERFIQHWLRQVAPQASRLFVAYVESFLERLAWKLRGHSQGRLHQQPFLELLNEMQSGDGPWGDVEQLLRTSPFLVRSSDGYYQFAFKVFEEFFYARYILRELGDESWGDVLDSIPPTSDCASFLLDLLWTEDGKSHRLRERLRRLLSEPYRPRISENALRLAYELSCQKSGAACAASKVQMESYLPETARLEGADLRGGQWSFAWLKGASLTNARLDSSDLSHANFQEVDGQGLTAQGAILDGTDFTQALLQGADFSSSIAFRERPLFNHANLRSASLRSTSWLLPELSHAEVDNSDETLARWYEPGRQVVSERESAQSFARPHSGSLLTPSPDGTLLVTCTGSTPILWEILSGRPLVVFSGHTESVCELAFSPDGRFLASASGDSMVCLWDVFSGDLCQQLRGHGDSKIWSLAFSPTEEVLATGDEDGIVRLWDCASGRLLRTFQVHEEHVLSMSFSSDGHFLATGSSDTTIRIWNVALKHHVQTLRGHQDEVVSIAFHPQQSNQLASLCEGGELRIWSVEQGTSTALITDEDNEFVKIAFNGSYLAALSDSGTLLVWNAGSRRLTRKTPLGDIPMGMVFLPGESNRLVIATARTLWLESAELSTGPRSVMTSGEGVNSAVFLPEERLILGGDNGTVLQWDLRTGKCLFADRQKSGFLELAASSDATRIAVSSSAGRIEVREPSGASLIRIQNRYSVSQIVFSPDGRRLAVAGDKVWLWDVSSTHAHQLFSLGERGFFEGVAFSPVEPILATVSSEKGLQFWNAVDGTPLAQPNEQYHGARMGLAFSWQGHLLAAADDVGTVCLWHMPEGQVDRLLRGHEGHVRRIVFSPSGDLLMTASEDCTARVWRIQDGHCLQVLRSHEGAVTDVAFSPDGHRAVTTSQDGSAILWNTSTWESLATFTLLKKGWAILAGAYADLSPEADWNSLLVRQGARCAPLSLLQDVCVRPDLVRAALAGQSPPELKLNLGAAEQLIRKPADS